MGSSYFTNPLAFLIQTLFGVYIVLLLLRLLLQVVRADFYNPLSQFVVKLTDPVLRPMRRVIPGYGGVDWASLLLMWILQGIELMLLLAIAGSSLHIVGPFLWAIPQLVSLVINVYLFAILIQVILSWVAPDQYHPAVVILYRLTGPLLAPARRMLPTISGIDLSPMVVMIALVLLEMLIIPPLNALTGSPFG